MSAVQETDRLAAAKGEMGVTPSDKKVFTLPVYLTHMAGLAVACITATWVFSMYFQSNELKAYQLAKDWKAPDAIKELAALSSDLRLSIAERREMESFRILPQQIDALKEQIAGLNQQLEAQKQLTLQATQDRNSLSATLKTVSRSGKSFSLFMGSSLYLVPNELLLGVTNISSMTCYTVLGNSTNFMAVGEYVTGSIDKLSYKLSLTGIDENGCNFQFLITQ